MPSLFSRTTFTRALFVVRPEVSSACCFRSHLAIEKEHRVSLFRVSRFFQTGRFKPKIQNSSVFLSITSPIFHSGHKNLCSCSWQLNHSIIIFDDSSDSDHEAPVMPSSPPMLVPLRRESQLVLPRQCHLKTTVIATCRPINARSFSDPSPIE